MKFTGQITIVMPEVGGTSQSGKQWRRKSYVCRYDNSNPQYPKEIVFDVMGDKIDQFNIQKGGQYELDVDFTSREYQGKHYMQATAWKVTLLDQPQATPQQSVQPQVAQPQQSQPAPHAVQPADNDPLPF